MKNNLSFLAEFVISGSNKPGNSDKSLQPDTIQRCIEDAISDFDARKTHAQVVFSSRTDAGVHALNATGHVDLPVYRGRRIDTGALAYCFNRYFDCNKKTIQINCLKRVNDDFHARFMAKSRTYLYRLATVKPEYADLPDVKYFPEPIEDSKRVYFVKNPNFEIERAKEAIKLFEGVHDFGSFYKTPKSAKNRKLTIRNIFSADVARGRSLYVFRRDCVDYYDYWDITFKGSGFVHNQVRRMVGALVSAGLGAIRCDDIITMLRVPSKHSWCSCVQKVPPYGLYLADVEYDENDLAFDDITVE